MKPPKPHRPEGFHAKQLVSPGIDLMSVPTSPAFHLHTRGMLSILHTHTCIPLIHLILGRTIQLDSSLAFVPLQTLDSEPGPCTQFHALQSTDEAGSAPPPRSPRPCLGGVGGSGDLDSHSSPVLFHSGCLSFSPAQLESESSPHGGSTNPAAADALC